MKRRLTISRRQLLLGGGAAALVGITSAFCVEPKWLQVTEHDVPVEGLPKLLDGYRIAHITDAHLKQIGLVEQAILREIGSRDVSLVVMTGDIIDNIRHRNVLEEFCSGLQTGRRAVLAVPGNWEHLSHIPINDLREQYRAHNIKLLINESELIESAISVAAADDLRAGNVQWKKILNSYSPAAANLFLTHSPALLDRIPARIGRFHLTLAGHTHGGQCRIGSFAPVRPPGSGRFVSGWYQVPTGNAYISRGTGTSVIPIRIACRPELPIFTLRQA